MSKGTTYCSPDGFVGVSMLVKPITESVTSRPIDQLMLFMVVAKTIGSLSINDTFVVFPPFPILVLVYFIFKDHMSWALLAVAMASLGWPYDARLIRSVALSLRTREFTTQSLFSG